MKMKSIIITMIILQRQRTQSVNQHYKRKNLTWVRIEPWTSCVPGKNVNHYTIQTELWEQLKISLMNCLVTILRRSSTIICQSGSYFIFWFLSINCSFFFILIYIPWGFSDHSQVSCLSVPIYSSPLISNGGIPWCLAFSAISKLGVQKIHNHEDGSIKFLEILLPFILFKWCSQFCLHFVICI